jgi:hypothetical protein
MHNWKLPLPQTARYHGLRPPDRDGIAWLAIRSSVRAQGGPPSLPEFRSSYGGHPSPASSLSEGCAAQGSARGASQGSMVHRQVYRRSLSQVPMRERNT